MWVFDIVNPLNGNHVAEVTKVIRNPSWATRLHSVGDSKFELQLRGSDLYSAAEWRSITSQWARALVVSWDDGTVRTAVQAGLISNRSWDRKSGVLTVDTEELLGQLSWRNVNGVSSYDPDGALVISGKSKRGILRAYVQAGLNRGDSSFYWNYNVDLGPDYPGSEPTLTHPHHKLQNVLELVKEIRDGDGGPDMHLDPEWRGGVLWWVLRLGTPRLAGASFEWSQDAAHTPLSSTLVEDGSRMVTGVFVAGEGEGSAKIVGLAGFDEVGPVTIPYRDRTVDYGLVDQQWLADALALEELRAGFYPSRAKSLSLTIDEDVDPGAIRIGSRVGVWSSGDEFEEESTFDGYVVGVKSSSALSLELEVLPWV